MKTTHHLWSSGLAIAAGLFLTSSCVPVFSELQSARTAGKNNFEITGGYSAVGNVENNQNHIGLQAAYGITDHFDMRMRYEYLWVADEGGNVNVIGFGPKLEAIENWLSFYVPLGFAFGGDLEDRDAMDTWEIHPTVLFSVPLGKYFEVNTSTKYIHEFQKDGWRFIAFDLGMGISTDLSKYAIRPEIGWAWSMNGEDDVYSQFSVGVTLYPGAFKKKE